MPIMNRKVVLTRRPGGLPSVDDFEVVDEPVGTLQDGEVLVEVHNLGIDAFIATTLDHDGHHGQSGLREPVMALGTGKVVESRSDSFAAGDYVIGGMGAQTHRIEKAEKLRKIDVTQAPERAYLGLMGLTTGLTAYAGMILVGEVQEGDTVAVSGAAGAVGTVACQLAKIKGARVIGIAGGPEKCDYLRDIGCDGTIDYKNADVNAALRELAPDGINVFFDNVGGTILDAALDNLAMGARVVLCGAISQYANMADVRGPSLYLRIAERNSSMRGFTVDYYEDQFPAMIGDIATWAAQGSLQLHEHVETGIERFPEVLGMLYTGGHRGKLILQVKDATG